MEMQLASRKPGWESALSEYLAAYHHNFLYGDHDCFTFTAGAIQAQTGIDITESVKYISRREALSAIRERRSTRLSYADSMASAFASVVSPYGIEPCPLKLCRRGDPIVIQQGHASASLGIISLTGRDIITVTTNGIMRLPMRRAISGFSL